jgi:xylulokinase
MDPAGRLHTFCHAIPGRWHVMGVTQAAGLSLRWYRDNFGAASPEVQKEAQKKDGRDPYDVFAEEATRAPVGSEGALWVPYLMGERTPHLDPNARAALIGLTASHTRAHVIRAIMEGVAYSLKDTFTIFEEMKIPVTSIRLGGGGARSPLWRQIQADVYGREVEIVAAEEGAAYGAAILAGAGAGAWSSVEQACDAVVRVAKRIPPNPNDCGTMRQGYQTYRKIYPALRQLA